MPIPPNVVAAGVKSAGGVAQALIGRYRPAGVPRTGSAEDRAAAYQRLIDAGVAAYNNHYLWRDIRVRAGKDASRLLEAQLPAWWAGGTELIAALYGVRLRGTLQVIAAAENLATAIAKMSVNEDDDDIFQKGVDGVIAAHKGFLNVAREDLAYDTPWWNLPQRHKDKKFRQQQESMPPRDQRLNASTTPPDVAREVPPPPWVSAAGSLHRHIVRSDCSRGRKRRVATATVGGPDETLAAGRRLRDL